VSHVAVLKGGRSLERGVSLRSGARVEDALERLGHRVTGIDVGHDLVGRLRDEAPDAAFVALHGRDGEDGTVQELLEILGIPYTGSGVGACMRCADKVLAKHAFRAAGLPTPDFFAFSEAAFKELGAADALGAIEERLGFPIVVKPADQGSALGIKFAAATADVPAALVAAFSYSSRVLLERHVHGRDLAVSVLDGEALPVVEACRAERTSTTSRPATRSAARRSSARRSSTATSAPEHRRSRSPPTRRWAARASRRGPDARRRHRRARAPRGQRHPRSDRDEPAAPGRRRRGIGFDALVERILAGAVAGA